MRSGINYSLGKYSTECVATNYLVVLIRSKSFIFVMKKNKFYLDLIMALQNLARREWMVVGTDEVGIHSRIHFEIGECGARNGREKGESSGV